MSKEKLPDLRVDYKKDVLHKSDLDKDPMVQFEKWLHEALQFENEVEANAMVLATTNAEGKPSARVVLLKGLIDQGFVFFTNYASRKGKEISENPLGALVFWWRSLQRQVRVEGTIKKTDHSVSTKYFQSRPLLSQASASISPQSQVIPNRDYLIYKFLKTQKSIEAGEMIQKPESWGGYILLPQQFEFWQGRANRLHDRFQYIWENKNWKLERLAP